MFQSELTDGRTATCPSFECRGVILRTVSDAPRTCHEAQTDPIRVTTRVVGRGWTENLRSVVHEAQLVGRVDDAEVPTQVQAVVALGVPRVTVGEARKFQF